MYLGDEGFIICTMAFGDDVSRIPQFPIGRLFDVTGLRPRNGLAGVLYLWEHTKGFRRLEAHDFSFPFVFPYDMTAVLNDFATRISVQYRHPGAFANVAWQVQQVQDKLTNDPGYPNLVVYGTDMEGEPVGPLRQWRYEEHGMRKRPTHITQGLNVVRETTWSHDDGRYVPRTDGAIPVECTSRTAVEVVSNVPVIFEHFHC
ncbi:hypothetical protein N9L19_00165 [bacterium]|nr:hypothetical protein [bacterium]MDA8609306.1 hypothetical protein [bacterium]